MSDVCVDASWGVDYQNGYEVLASWGHTIGTVELDASWGYGFRQELDLEASWGYKLLEEETYQIFVAQPVIEVVPGAGGSPISVNNYYSYGSALTVAGVTFSADRMKAMSIVERRNNPSTLDAEIWDPEFIYGPFGSQADLVDVNTHKDGVVSKYWKPKIQIRNQVWESSPNFVLLASEWNLDNQGRAFVKVSGVDYSQLLLEHEDTALGDYVSTPGDLYTAVRLIKIILAEYGITNYRIDIRDYPILKFSAVGGNPFDWIKTLLYFAQAEWWFEGDTFVARTPNFFESPAWTLEDRYVLSDFKYTKQRVGLFNELVVNKEELTSAIVAEKECRGKECLGFQNVSWDTPLRSAQVWVKDVTRGDLHSWVWKDKTQEAIAGIQGAPARFSQQTPIYEVGFIYEPIKPGAVGTPTAWPPGVIPGYKLQVIGQPFIEDAIFRLGFDEKFRVRKVNEDGQERFGKKLGSTISTSILGRKDDVAFLLGRVLEENARKENVASTGVNIMNPWIRAASILRLKVGLAGFPNGKNFVLESIVKNCTTGTMQLDLTRANAMQ